MGIGIIVDIILLIVVAGNAIYNYRRGFTSLVVGLVSSILAIVLVFILYKPVTSYIMNNTSIPDKLEKTLTDNVAYLFEGEDVASIEVGSNSEIGDMLYIFAGKQINDFIDSTKENIIEFLSFEITKKIIYIVTFLLLFIIVRFVLYLLSSYLEAIADLPFIRILDGSGGMVIGIIKGFLVIYLFLAIISLVMPIIGNTAIISAIQKAPIGSKMLNNNILLKFIFN